ncbi:RsiW-degrading membrane proteinase PrsW (M82 family) [Arcanobacterium pluranimalium]|uniref:PrsW family intramembrane metalloprotease n=1 Tax=Arcanobacterium pluranimalium TaxID=108028 RepID=UPI001958A733|nr:PrsW family intramembrane metalloprotease [Arcanobacterium pluranimalium]MBM7825473.1 RsiW-degrading membrane proteinase PrsW (M82 family) [Arcanobacterium pluranimalium]
MKRRRASAFIVAIIMTMIGVFGFWAILPELSRPQGISGLFGAALYAIIPVVAIGFFVWLIDSWEPEPLWMYAAAFAWGAGSSIVLAVVLNDYAGQYIAHSSIIGSGSQPEVKYYLSAYVAPLTEEFSKGLGVILIYKLLRSYFNGPVDGIVYGALVGSGFAFTENILYFVRNYDVIEQVFKVRFLDGPLNHEAWTAAFGFFLGFAVFTKGRFTRSLWLIPATISAVAGHWFNNAALSFPGMTYESYVIWSNVPIAIIMTGFAIYARWQQKRFVVQGLQDYVDAGWLLPSDIDMILSLARRMSAQNWSETRMLRRGLPKGRGAETMKDYQNALIELGYFRTTALRIGQVQTAENRERERNLLNEIVRLRTLFAGNEVTSDAISR